VPLRRLVKASVNCRNPRNPKRPIPAGGFRRCARAAHKIPLPLRTSATTSPTEPQAFTDPSGDGLSITIRCEVQQRMRAHGARVGPSLASGVGLICA
jgi:hypothetical protein